MRCAICERQGASFSRRHFGEHFCSSHSDVEVKNWLARYGYSAPNYSKPLSAVIDPRPLAAAGVASGPAMFLGYLATGGAAVVMSSTGLLTGALLVGAAVLGWNSVDH